MGIYYCAQVRPSGKERASCSIIEQGQSKQGRRLRAPDPKVFATADTPALDNVAGGANFWKWVGHFQRTQNQIRTGIACSALRLWGIRGTSPFDLMSVVTDSVGDDGRHKKKRKNASAHSVRTGPSPDDAHDIVYFKRHVKDDPSQAEPGRDALRSWPTSVRAKAIAVLIAVAAAPPKRFAGGGYWEAMKGDMSGWFEVRIDGRKRHHYRLFCLLDYTASGQERPLLTVVTNRSAPR